MRRVAVLLLAFTALWGCGNKSGLYLPTQQKESPQQQNSKTAPRQ